MKHNHHHLLHVKFVQVQQIAYDYGDNGNYDSSRYQHHYETTGPSASTKYIHGKLLLFLLLLMHGFLTCTVFFRANDLFVYLTFVYFSKGDSILSYS